MHPFGSPWSSTGSPQTQPSPFGAPTHSPPPPLAFAPSAAAGFPESGVTSTEGFGAAQEQPPPFFAEAPPPAFTSGGPGFAPPPPISFGQPPPPPRASTGGGSFLTASEGSSGGGGGGWAAAAAAVAAATAPSPALAASPRALLLSFPSLSTATSGFAPSRLLAVCPSTGARTFAAQLEPFGAVAVHLLSLPPQPGAPALEQGVLALSRLRHANVSRLLGYATASPSSPAEAEGGSSSSSSPATATTEPLMLALVYEHPSGGSLRSCLRPSSGTPLTAAQRVGIAITVLRGVAYVHSGQVEGEGGGSSTGGGSPLLPTPSLLPAAQAAGSTSSADAAAAAPSDSSSTGSPTLLPPLRLHGDVTSANICLLPQRASAKLQPTWGLLAGRQRDGSGSGSGSELPYTVEQEMRGVGVVLFELLTGAAVAGDTALSELQAAARRISAPPACSSSSSSSSSAAPPPPTFTADPVWPAAAASALASLVLRCTEGGSRRPPSARALLAQLDTLVPLAAAPPRTGSCGVCLEEFEESQGLRCHGAAAAAHFLCFTCMNGQVRGATTPAELKAAAGGLRCPYPAEGGGKGLCGAVWPQEQLLPVLEPELVRQLLAAATYAMMHSSVGGGGGGGGEGKKEAAGGAAAAAAAAGGSSFHAKVKALCAAWVAAPAAAAASSSASLSGGGGGAAAAPAAATATATSAPSAGDRGTILLRLQDVLVNHSLYLHCPNCGTVQELTSACPSVTCGKDDAGVFHAGGGCGFSYQLGGHDSDRGARLVQALRLVAPPALRSALLDSMQGILKLHSLTRAGLLQALEKAAGGGARGLGVGSALQARAAAAAAAAAEEAPLCRGDCTGYEAALRDRLSVACKQGDWAAALALLEPRPDLLNAAPLPAALALPMRSRSSGMQQENYTPLHWAVEQGRLSAVQALLRMGASPFQRLHAGESSSGGAAFGGGFGGGALTGFNAFGVAHEEGAAAARRLAWPQQVAARRPQAPTLPPRPTYSGFGLSYAPAPFGQAVQQQAAALDYAVQGGEGEEGDGEGEGEQSESLGIIPRDTLCACCGLTETPYNTEHFSAAASSDPQAVRCAFCASCDSSCKAQGLVSGVSQSLEAANARAWQPGSGEGGGRQRSKWGGQAGSAPHHSAAPFAFGGGGSSGGGGGGGGRFFQQQQLQRQRQQQQQPFVFQQNRPQQLSFLQHEQQQQLQRLQERQFLQQQQQQQQQQHPFGQQQHPFGQQLQNLLGQPQQALPQQHHQQALPQQHHQQMLRHEAQQGFESAWRSATTHFPDLSALLAAAQRSLQPEPHNPTPMELAFQLGHHALHAAMLGGVLARETLPPAEVALRDMLHADCMAGRWLRVLQVLRSRGDLLGCSVRLGSVGEGEGEGEGGEEEEEEEEAYEEEGLLQGAAGRGAWVEEQAELAEAARQPPSLQDSRSGSYASTILRCREQRQRLFRLPGSSAASTTSSITTSTSTRGFTALHYAARAGATEVVRVLLRAAAQQQLLLQAAGNGSGSGSGFAAAAPGGAWGNGSATATAVPSQATAATATATAAAAAAAAPTPPTLSAAAPPAPPAPVELARAGGHWHTAAVLLTAGLPAPSPATPLSRATLSPQEVTLRDRYADLARQGGQELLALLAERPDLVHSTRLPTEPYTRLRPQHLCQGWTALHYAAKRGATEAALTLVHVYSAHPGRRAATAAAGGSGSGGGRQQGGSEGGEGAGSGGGGENDDGEEEEEEEYESWGQGEGSTPAQIAALFGHSHTAVALQDALALFQAASITLHTSQPWAPALPACTPPHLHAKWLQRMTCRALLPPAEVALRDALADACDSGAWGTVFRILRWRRDLVHAGRLPSRGRVVVGSGAGLGGAPLTPPDVHRDPQSGWLCRQDDRGAKGGGGGGGGGGPRDMEYFASTVPAAVPFESLRWAWRQAQGEAVAAAAAAEVQHTLHAIAHPTKGAPTPLLAAAAQGATRVALRLVRVYGANPSWGCRGYSSAAAAAAGGGHAHTAAVLEALEADPALALLPYHEELLPQQGGGEVQAGQGQHAAAFQLRVAASNPWAQ